MAEKTDLRKVQGALNRATKNSVDGPKEARAEWLAPTNGEPATPSANQGVAKGQ